MRIAEFGQGINRELKFHHTNKPNQCETPPPPEHFIVVNSLLRQTPFDPVTHPEVDDWVKRLQSTVANLNSAFLATAGQTPEGPSYPYKDVCRTHCQVVRRSQPI